MARKPYPMANTVWQDGKEIETQSDIDPNGGRVLTVIGPADKKNYYRVRCSCRNATVFTVLGASIRSGNTRSCGCMKRGPSSIPGKMSGRKRKPVRFISTRGLLRIDKEMMLKLDAYIVSCGVEMRPTLDGRVEYWARNRQFGPFDNALQAIGHIMAYATVDDVRKLQK